MRQSGGLQRSRSTSAESSEAFLRRSVSRYLQPCGPFGLLRRLSPAAVVQKQPQATRPPHGCLCSNNTTQSAGQTAPSGCGLSAPGLDNNIYPPWLYNGLKRIVFLITNVSRPQLIKSESLGMRTQISVFFLKAAQVMSKCSWH